MPKGSRGAPEYARGLSRSDLSSCIVLAGVYADKTTAIPTAGAAGIERKRAVDERNGGVDVLPAPTKDERGVGEDAGVVVGDRQRPFRQSYGLVAACHGIFRPTVEAKSKVAYAGPR